MTYPCTVAIVIGGAMLVIERVLLALCDRRGRSGRATSVHGYQHLNPAENDGLNECI
jgi:hypothetical protein